MPPFTFKNVLLCLLATSFLSFSAHAGDNKKKNSPYEKASILQKAWGDLTTRNNMYFNANEVYKDILKRHEQNHRVDYNDTIPFYFHDKTDLLNYTPELQTISKKMGIVLQLHDYSRWRDNAYILLGKSQFLQQKYDTALITFQYIVTTMKPEMLSNKLEITNKERMKYLRKRQKEIDKKAGEKQKFIELKWKEDQKAQEEKLEDARDKQQAAIEQKKKEIEEIIKAKKKVIELQKKGKKVPPELLAKAKGKTNKDTTTVILPDKEPEKKPKYDPNLPYVLMGDEYVKNPFYKDSADRKNDQPLKDQLSQKAEEGWDKLSFWEKIKHKSSRPEAIVWMAKSLIETGNYADAQGIIAYGKALRKLTLKQRKDLYLVDAYYQLRRNNVPLAIEKLENTMLLLKKKQERAHYEFLLAQLYSFNDQPADASDYFEKVAKHTNDETTKFYAQLYLSRLYSNYPELSGDDVEKMLLKLVKYGKNIQRADEVYYNLANYHSLQGDTAQAIKDLQKSIAVSVDNDPQKGLSFLKLGQIRYEHEAYAAAKSDYDSAVAFLPVEHRETPEAKLRQDVLSDLARYMQTIHDQDSIQRLGRMAPAELETYLADLKAAQEKSDKKKNRFSSDDGSGSSSGALVLNTPSKNIKYSSNGLWYFYNPDIKASGYSSFKSIWGDRPLKENWRRSIKSDFDLQDNSLSDNTEPGSVKKDTTAADPTLQIPKTPEDFIASDKRIASALFNAGELFKNRLNNIPKSKQMFDELIRRFPNSENDAIAHYYVYLILKEQNLHGLASKEKQYILDNYPMSDIAVRIRSLDDSLPSDAAGLGSAESLYASTYQLFQNGQYDKVIQNKSQAAIKYPNTPELQQFEFLEALSYGKQRNIPLYKTSLSNIVMKYSGGEVREKAQQYLVALLELEDRKDSSIYKIPEPVPLKDTLALPEFVIDTSDFWVVITLDDPYFQLQQLVSSLQSFANKKSEKKVKVNPVFLQNNQAVLTFKRFEYQHEAVEFLDKLYDSRDVLFGDKADKVNSYIITPSNFKKLQSFDQFPAYEQFYQQNYTQE